MDPDKHLCLHCDGPIQRDPGQKGPWPKLHPDCREPFKAAKAQREREARIDEALNGPEPEWWKSWKAKIAKRDREWFPDEPTLTE